MPSAGSPVHFLLLVLILPATVASAGSFYVRPDGSDEKCNGRADEPAGKRPCAWQTIQRCAGAVSAGDTCHIAEGIYQEHSIAPAKSGKPGKWITFAGPEGSAGDPSCDHDWNGKDWVKCARPSGTAVVDSSDCNFKLTRGIDYVRIRDMRLSDGILLSGVRNIEILDSVIYCGDCGGPGMIRMLSAGDVTVDNVLMWTEAGYLTDSGNGPTAEQSSNITISNSTIHNVRNLFQWRWCRHIRFENLVVYDVLNHPGDIHGSDYITIRNWVRYKTQKQPNSLAGSCIPDIYCSDHVLIQDAHCVGADYTGEGSTRDMPYAWSVSSTSRSRDAMNGKCLEKAQDVDGDDGFHCNYSTPAPNAGRPCTPGTAETDCPGASDEVLPKCVNDKVVSEHLTVVNVNGYWPKYACFKLARHSVRWNTVEMHHNNCYGPNHDRDGDGVLEDGECSGPKGNWERYWHGDGYDLDGDGCPNMLDDWLLWDWDNDGKPGGPPVNGYTLGQGSMEHDPRMRRPQEGDAPYNFRYRRKSPMIDAGCPDIDMDGKVERQVGGADECEAAKGCVGAAPDIGARRYEYVPKPPGQRKKARAADEREGSR